MAYLLDTNICVFFLRGKMDLDKIMKERGRENCYISEITVFELRFGAENSDDIVKSHKAVNALSMDFLLFPFMVLLNAMLKKKSDLEKWANPCMMSLTF